MRSAARIAFASQRALHSANFGGRETLELAPAGTMFSSALRAQRFRALGGVRFHSMEHAIGAQKLHSIPPRASPALPPPCELR